MPEPVNGMSELSRDGGVEMDIDVAEEVDSRRDLAREFLENKMLILGFGPELGRLEQAFAIPLGVRNDVTGAEIGVGQHPLACKRRVALVERLLDERLGFLNETIVL